MRATLITFLSALLLSGCSPKHTAYIDQTIDIVAGKDIVVRDYVLSVRKRAGNSLEGVRILRREPDGKETIITANTGTITQGAKQNVEATPADAKTQDRLKVVLIRNTVKMTLFNANVQTKTKSGTTRMTVQKMELVF